MTPESLATLTATIFPVLVTATLCLLAFGAGLLCRRFMTRRTASTLLVCVLILGAGAAAMKVLGAMKKRPPQAEAREAVLRVEARQVQPEDVQVTIKGYGEVRVLDTVAIAPEVPGRVVRVHRNLEVGGQIREGEVLFEIDSRDYEAQLAQAEANAAMSKNIIARLEEQYGIDKGRLKTLERSRELAKAEFERMRELYEKDQVGTKSACEQAERAYNGAADMAEQLGQAVTLYPVRIREAENGLAAAQAQRELARISRERTSVRAPFNARVKQVALEAGQYVAPGVGVVSLADDSVLEIAVGLNSHETAKWLRFESSDAGNPFGDVEPDEVWFRGVEPVACAIRWTEDREHHRWTGTLNRVAEFDRRSRTITLAVRIQGENARSADPDHLPLVEGMFCEVSIPGRTLEGLYRLPSAAVNFEGVVYRSVDGRLRSTQVEKAFIEGKDVWIARGLSPGDIVVTTRLVDPLENSLLDIISEQAAEAAGRNAGEAAAAEGAE